MTDVVVVHSEGYVGKWWGVVLRGLLALVMGFLLITRTGDTAQALVQLFGIFAIVDGIIVGIMAIVGRKELDDWLHLLLQGVLGFAVGLILFTAPGMTLGLILLVIAIWALVGGALQLIAAWRIRKTSDMEWILVITGLISLLFGWLLLRNPADVSEFILTLVGIFLILSGIAGTIFGLKLKGLQ